VFAVTVNTVTITDVAVEAALCPTWPEFALTEAPTPLTGGQWATMFRLAATGVPVGVPEDLVLRIVPHAEMGAKELAVQRGAADAGVPTPAVRLSGPADGPVGGAWAVMDFAAGAPLLSGLDGTAAVRRFPQIVRRLPGQLADTMAAVHRVDPQPIVDEVRAAAPSVALTVDELWPHLRAAAEMSGEPSLLAATDALMAAQPDQGNGVLCHGDLHPFNALVDGDEVTVLDWTAALVAPPAYDVAFTWLLLRHPPLEAAPALRPVISTAAGVLARRFVRRYRTVDPSADLDRMDWYAAVHAVRVLTDFTAWQRDGNPLAQKHPWRLVAPGAAAVLAGATGIEVDASGAA